MNGKSITFILAVLVAGVGFEMHSSALTRLFVGPVVQTVDGEDEVGFRPVDCWFATADDWPAVDCYFMQVPEAHADPDGRVIAFPVAIFHARGLVRTGNPVLHLGGGGPGSPVGLDASEAVARLWRHHAPMSIDQGRDLFVIDPRGAGLARPALRCETLLQNVRRYLRGVLPLADQVRRIVRDYRRCMRTHLQQGVDLGQYNSTAIARDIEWMRERSHVDQWVLYGVSYAGLYAQIIAQAYPDRVEAMVLDSSVMLGRRWHDDFVNRTLRPWRVLEEAYRRRGYDGGSERRLMDRLFALYRSLDSNPRSITVANPYGGDPVTVTMTGDRLLDVILNGMYGEAIFEDIGPLVHALERGDDRPVSSYVEDYAAYWLSPDYADISAVAHYCHDDRPYLDFERMKSLARAELDGVIRQRTIAAIEAPDNCDLVGEVRPADAGGAPQPTGIPTLFLHGNLDTITPISDVLAQKRLFRHSKLLRFDLSHDIMNGHECAHYASAWFLEDPDIPLWKLDCRQ